MGLRGQTDTSAPRGAEGISNVAGNLVLAPTGDITLTPGAGGALILAQGRVNFPSTANASADANTLDDYEEGTWTPVLEFDANGDLSVVYTRQVGTYVKIGRLVVIGFQILTSTFTHTTAVGNCRVSGFPFTTNAATNSQVGGELTWTGITNANYTDISLQMTVNGTKCDLIASASAQGLAVVIAADMPSAGNVHFIGSVSYFTS